MDPIRAAGVVSFIAVSFLVGLRLLGLARRRGEMPELAVGLALLLGGGLGYLLMFASARLGEDPGVRGALTSLGALCLNLGAICLWYFTWRVFRPDRAWAGILVAVAAAAAMSSYLHEALTTGFAFRQFRGFWYWSGFGARSLCYGWAAFESLNYYVLMRRRMRHGLADPLLANRFLLWALAAAGAFLIFLVIFVNLLGASGGNPTAGVFDNDAALLISALGLVASLALWLAFFPPPAWRRRFRPGALASAGRGARG